MEENAHFALRDEAESLITTQFSDCPAPKNCVVCWRCKATKPLHRLRCKPFGDSARFCLGSLVAQEPCTRPCRRYGELQSRLHVDIEQVRRALEVCRLQQSQRIQRAIVLLLCNLVFCQALEVLQ